MLEILEHVKFHEKKKSRIPLNYPCKPCENYIQVGFTNTRES